MIFKSETRTDGCPAANRVQRRWSCCLDEKQYAGYIIRSVVALFLCLSLKVMASPPEFEVASVKLNKRDGPTDVVPKHAGTLVTMHNVLVGSMILYAYKAELYQVAGGDQKLRLPDGWNWYDVDARVSGGASDEEIRLMFQSLLANRFGLMIHHVTQSVTGYMLRVANSPTKPKVSPRVPVIPALAAAGCSIRGGIDGNHLLCRNATSEQIANLLARQLRVPIADQTDRRDAYDCDITYTPEDAVDTPHPSLVSAIRDVLRLRLIRGTVPVEMLVIDKLEKPTEN
jgi:uncharacterized protein (TIGR03435 family)